MIDCRTILTISRVLLQDKEARRKIMFYSSIITMVLVFSGAFLLSGTLQKSWVLFLGFWGLCFASTLFMLLMALYDLLSVRAQHRLEMRKLRKRMQDAVEDETKG